MLAVGIYGQHDAIEILQHAAGCSVLAYEPAELRVPTCLAGGRVQADPAHVANAALPAGVYRLTRPTGQPLCMAYVARPDGAAVLFSLCLPAGAVLVAPVAVIDRYLETNGRLIHVLAATRDARVAAVQFAC